MTSIVKADIIELRKINDEIKKLGQRCKQLRAKAKEVESRIMNYLEESDQPGVKYNGTVFLLEQKPKRVRMKKSQKNENVLKVLRDHGVHDADALISKLFEAQRGQEIEQQRIRIRKL